MWTDINNGNKQSVIRMYLVQPYRYVHTETEFDTETVKIANDLLVKYEQLHTMLFKPVSIDFGTCYSEHSLRYERWK